jgi:hypothetical protein
MTMLAAWSEKTWDFVPFADPARGSRDDKRADFSLCAEHAVRCGWVSDARKMAH